MTISHCQSSPDSFDLAPDCLPSCQPLDQAIRLGLWVFLQAVTVHIRCRHLFINSQSESCYSFYCPGNVEEDWVDTALKVRSSCPRLRRVM